MEINRKDSLVGPRLKSTTMVKILKGQTKSQKWGLPEYTNQTQKSSREQKRNPTSN
jgi:hypothetical protein